MRQFIGPVDLLTFCNGIHEIFCINRKYRHIHLKNIPLILPTSKFNALRIWLLGTE